MTSGAAIYFVCRQAVARLPELPREDRDQLLVGLKLMLPIAEYEQCEAIADSITAIERAKRRAEEAQLILGDMLAEAPER